MKRTKSSQPEETETVDVFASMRALVETLISSRRPAMVPAGWKEKRNYMYMIAVYTCTMVMVSQRPLFLIQYTEIGGLA